MINMRKRYGRGRISNFLMAFLILLACGMGIGYAALSTTLTIDGTSDIDRASWSVIFENVQVTTGSVNATAPSITDDTSVGFSVNLEDPGDFYEFKVDVTNDGTFDAYLSSMTITPTLTSAQQNYFAYTVTYEDGTAISLDDALDAGDTETILVRFEYLTQSNPSLYPTADDSLNFSVTMNYVQGTGNAVVHNP